MSRVLVFALVLFSFCFSSVQAEKDVGPENETLCSLSLSRIALHLHFFKRNPFLDLGGSRLFKSPDSRGMLIDYVKQLSKQASLNRKWLQGFLDFLRNADASFFDPEKSLEVHAKSQEELSVAEAYESLRTAYAKIEIEREMQTASRLSQNTRKISPLYSMIVTVPSKILWKLRYPALLTLVLFAYEPVQSLVRQMGYQIFSEIWSQVDNHYSSTDDRFEMSQTLLQNIDPQLTKLYFHTNGHYESIDQMSRNNLNYFYDMILKRRTDLGTARKNGDEAAVRWNLAYLYLVPYLYRDLFTNQLSGLAKEILQQTFEEYDPDGTYRKGFQQRYQAMFSGQQAPPFYDPKEDHSESSTRGP